MQNVRVAVCVCTRMFAAAINYRVAKVYTFLSANIAQSTAQSGVRRALKYFR